MIESVYVGDNFEILVTILHIETVTNIMAGFRPSLLEKEYLGQDFKNKKYITF